MQIERGLDLAGLFQQIGQTVHMLVLSAYPDAFIDPERVLVEAALQNIEQAGEKVEENLAVIFYAHYQAFEVQVELDPKQVDRFGRVGPEHAFYHFWL
ncbi:hypothetical protein BpHYR1_005895 [Brachionus plicatilis]|uniref:Uncharacterized protein n=1 Tax=Brachionus plicatilis TaxID=10195 RepID=A0A3M7QL64_BRAPC|nr:hypothetical protein BpHYR1_005895 [Brachionus plicatilis]